MKSNGKPRLSIFETFKTKTEELTGEATRQRSIIVCLATQSNPTDRTRTAISQQIAEQNGIAWKNIYSGIFRDLDEVLIPLEIVVEEGRLPLKRGPKALQEKGIINSDDIENLRIASLLHDIGHGPFSHLYIVLSEVALHVHWNHRCRGGTITLATVVSTAGKVVIAAGPSVMNGNSVDWSIRRMIGAVAFIDKIVAPVDR